VASVVVDDEPGQVKRGVVAGLPAGVGRQRAGQLDAMVVGRRKDLPDADITRVDQVGLGQQVAGREDCVAAGHGVQVGGGCIGGGHMGDQVGPVGLAHLGEVGLAAAPGAAAVDARPGIQVVGVKDQQLAGGRPVCLSRQRTWLPSR
jgi:hypothetical protein